MKTLIIYTIKSPGKWLKFKTVNVLPTDILKFISQFISHLKVMVVMAKMIKMRLIINLALKTLLLWRKLFIVVLFFKWFSEDTVQVKMVWTVLYFKTDCHCLKIKNIVLWSNYRYYLHLNFIIFNSPRCQFNRFWQWKFSFPIKTWSYATVSAYDFISYTAKTGGRVGGTKPPCCAFKEKVN